MNLRLVLLISALVLIAGVASADHHVDEFGFPCVDPFDGFDYCAEDPFFEEPPTNETFPGPEPTDPPIEEPPVEDAPVEEPPIEEVPEETVDPEPPIEEVPIEEDPVEDEIAVDEFGFPCVDPMTGVDFCALDDAGFGGDPFLGDPFLGDPFQEEDDSEPVVVNVIVDGGDTSDEPPSSDPSGNGFLVYGGGATGVAGILGMVLYFFRAPIIKALKRGYGGKDEDAEKPDPPQGSPPDPPS